MSKKAHKDVVILGINISSTPGGHLLVLSLKKINNQEKFTIFTPNAEIILKSLNNPNYRKTLNSADFALPDSMSVVMAEKFNSQRASSSSLRYVTYLLQGLRVGLSAIFAKSWLYQEMEVIKGREYFLDLVDLAGKNKLKIFLLGGQNDVAKKAVDKLSKKYKGLSIEHFQGPMLSVNAKPISRNDAKLQTATIDRINKFKPHILFIAFGAPKQELWIKKNISKLDINAAMVIGSTLDVVSGAVKLPPSVFSQLGLEWLWRFLINPRRIKRIINATIVFPWEIYLAKVQS